LSFDPEERIVTPAPPTVTGTGDDGPAPARRRGEEADAEALSPLFSCVRGDSLACRPALYAGAKAAAA
jgi:hypothetical protein